MNIFRLVQIEAFADKKAFADNNLNVVQLMVFIFVVAENIVNKEEIFPQYFLQQFFCGSLKHKIV